MSATDLKLCFIADDSKAFLSLLNLELGEHDKRHNAKTVTVNFIILIIIFDATKIALI